MEVNLEKFGSRIWISHFINVLIILNILLCFRQDMHYRRTCLLVEYEDANRALDKAKPQKKAAVK